MINIKNYLLLAIFLLTGCAANYITYTSPANTITSKVAFELDDPGRFISLDTYQESNECSGVIFIDHLTGKNSTKDIMFPSGKERAVSILYKRSQGQFDYSHKFVIKFTPKQDFEYKVKVSGEKVQVNIDGNVRDYYPHKNKLLKLSNSFKLEIITNKSRENGEKLLVYKGKFDTLKSTQYSRDLLANVQLFEKPKNGEFAVIPVEKYMYVRKVFKKADMNRKYCKGNNKSSRFDEYYWLSEYIKPGWKLHQYSVEKNVLSR